jgi:hypothetical protein
MIDDSAIREIVIRLARPTASGAHSIERAAILAEGSDCGDIEAWILRQGGEPQTNTTARLQGGLHAERVRARSARPGTAPTRYILPASSLT